MKRLSLLLLLPLLLCTSAGAQSFSDPVRLNTDAAGAAQEGVRIAIGPEGTLYAVWTDYRANNNGALMLATSADGGTTFTPERALYSGGVPTAGGRGAEIAIGNDGIIHIIWMSQGASETDVEYIRSTDGGETFSQPARISGDDARASQEFPSIAVDSSGGVYVAWIDNRDQLGQTSDFTQLYLARSTDGGASFAAPARISSFSSVADAGICECCATSTAASADGQVVVAFRSNINNRRDIHVVRSFTRGETFGTPIAAASEEWRIPACPMADPHIALDGEGKTHVVWQDVRPSAQGKQYLYYATLGREDSLFTRDLRLSDDATRTNSPSIGITPEGAIVVLASNSTLSGVETIYLQSLDGGNTFSPATRFVPGASERQLGAQLLIGPQGERYAVWQDDREGDFDVWFTRDESMLHTVTPEQPTPLGPLAGATVGPMVTFSWEAPANLGEATQTTYEISYEDWEGGIVTVGNIVGTSYTTEIAPWTYTWTIVAHTSIGSSAPTAPIEFTVSSTTDVLSPRSKPAFEIDLSEMSW